MPFKASKAQGKDWLMREPDEVEECEADVWKAKYMLKDEEVKELKQENLQLRWERDNALASLAADSSIVSSTSLVSSIASEATSSEDPSEEPSIEMDTVPSHTNSHMRELERKIDDLTLGNHDARLDNEILIRKVAALTKEKCKLEQDLTHERESRLASEKTHEKSLNVLTESKQSEVALERNVISWREKHDRLAEKMSNSMARIAFLEDQLRILTKEKVELEQSSARVQLQYAAEVADLKEKIGLTVTHLETARDRATTLRMTVQEQNDPSLTRDTEGIYSPPAVTYASQSPGSEHLEQAPPAIMAEQKTPGQHATHAGHERLPSVVASSQHNIQKFDALVSTLVAKSEPGDRVLIASLHREPKALAHAIKAMYRAHQDPSNEALLNTSPTVEVSLDGRRCRSRLKLIAYDSRLRRCDARTYRSPHASRLFLYLRHAFRTASPGLRREAEHQLWSAQQKFPHLPCKPLVR